MTLSGPAGLATATAGLGWAVALPFDAAHLRAMVIGSADLGETVMRAYILRRVALVEAGAAGGGAGLYPGIRSGRNAAVGTVRPTMPPTRLSASVYYLFQVGSALRSCALSSEFSASSCRSRSRSGATAISISAWVKRGVMCWWQFQSNPAKCNLKIRSGLAL